MCSREKALCIGLVMSIAFVSILGNYANAQDGDLILPTTLVTIEVSDGVDSYFDTELSNVPDGFSVTNATYHGWCIDVRTEMARSPVTHLVMLYSSLSPPGEMASEKWDMINYVLNHKQGSALDIQQAVWYFIHLDGGNYTPTSSLAWDIINDALVNGNGFIPGYGEQIAVVCFPVILFPSQPAVQVSIIEVASVVVPEFPSLVILVPLMVIMLIVAVTYRRQRVP